MTSTCDPVVLSQWDGSVVQYVDSQPMYIWIMIIHMYIIHNAHK